MGQKLASKALDLNCYAAFKYWLVNVPFWFWTSPSSMWSMCWRLYPQYWDDVFQTFTNHCILLPLCIYCKEENQCPSALIARRFSWWRVPVQCEPCHSAAFGYLCSKTSLKHPSSAFRKLCGQRSCAYGFGAFLIFHYAFNGSNWFKLHVSMNLNQLASAGCPQKRPEPFASKHLLVCIFAPGRENNMSGWYSTHCCWLDATWWDYGLLSIPTPESHESSPFVASVGRHKTCVLAKFQISYSAVGRNLDSRL